MSDPVSALNGASFNGLVRIEEAGMQGMITLRGDLASKPLKAAATGVSGGKMPEPNRMTGGVQGGICWMSPDEVLVLCPYAGVGAALEGMHKALGRAHALAVDVSDARAVFRVSGAAAREVMAKLAPVDFSPEAFTPRTFRRSRLAQVSAAFWMVDEQSFHIICFRSVAEYVFNLLKAAAQPGSGVGYFAAGADQGVSR